jgi:pimeloyl-ACP methyl ester carboxylesterase
MRKFAAAQGNVQIAYDVLGAGAPVLMLHDFGQSSGFWYESGYVKTCLAQARQVVLVDLRGHGDSSEPADSTAYGPVTCSQDVIAVLDHAGIRRADVLGDGVGGRIALCVAARAPDRVHAVAAGAAHPFAERAQRCRDALAKGLEPWGKLIETDAGMTIAWRRLTSNDPATLSVAGSCDWSDIAAPAEQLPPCMWSG